MANGTSNWNTTGPPSAHNNGTNMTENAPSPTMFPVDPTIANPWKRDLDFYTMGVVLPILIVLGIVGNILNIPVFR